MTNGNDSVVFVSGEATSNDNLGLTKREYFAAIAMQGLLASNSVFVGADDNWEYKVSQQAVKQADALITALNQQP